MNELISEINVLFYCIDHLCEVPFDNLTAAECTVEEVVSLTLLTIFGSILVHSVSITVPPAPACANAPIAISICAQGQNPYTLTDNLPLDCAIEARLSCAFIELFGTLDVERCAVA